jgi:hypothetical protein
MGVEFTNALDLDDDLARHQVEIQDGWLNVELPNGYNYDEGDFVELSVDDYDRIDPDSFAANSDADKPVISRGFFTKLPDDRWMAVCNAPLSVIDAVGDTLVKVRAPFGLTLDNVVFLPETAGTGDITVEVLTEGTPSGAVDAAADETQTLTRTSTGGTITLDFDGEVTATIPATAAGFTAAAVQAALDALDNVDEGDITVTGAAGGPLTLSFAGGQYDSTNVPQVIVDNTLATGGTIVAATTLAGDPAGTPVTQQINTAAIDANSAPFGINRESFDSAEADVAEGEYITLVATAVADDYASGEVTVLLSGAVA